MPELRKMMYVTCVTLMLHFLPEVLVPSTMVTVASTSWAGCACRYMCCPWPSPHIFGGRYQIAPVWSWPCNVEQSIYMKVLFK